MLTGYFQRNFILIVRYLMVGVLIYTIDMLSFVFSFYLLGLNELIANGFAKILAGILGFLLHKKFTFKINKNKDNAIQKYRYIYVRVFGLIVEDIRCELMFLSY